MSSVNRVILLGYLGHQPSLRKDINGQDCATASLATSQRWRDSSTGESKEHTEWHNIVFPPELASEAKETLQKGSPVWIVGRLHTHTWLPKRQKPGQEGKRLSAVQVIVESFNEMSKQTGYSGQYAAQDYYAPPQARNNAPAPHSSAPAPRYPAPQRNQASAPNAYQKAKG